MLSFISISELSISRLLVFIVVLSLLFDCSSYQRINSVVKTTTHLRNYRGILSSLTKEANSRKGYVSNDRCIKLFESNLDTIDTIENEILGKSDSDSVSISKLIVQNDIVDDFCVVSTFRNALQAALSGDVGLMSNILPKSSRWDNVFYSSANDFYESMKQFSSFFQQPVVTVFDSKLSSETLESSVYLISYQLSFWYPMAWRPRIIIPCTVRLEVTPKSDSKKDFTIISVLEKWDVSLLDIFMKQLLPRSWDILHVFSSPSPEYPPTNVLSKFGDGKNTVNIIKLAPSVNCIVEWNGLAKYPGPPLTCIPGFSLFGNLQTSKPNREEFFAVLPVEVTSSKYTSAVSGLEMKNSTWTFHVPTSLQHIVMDKARSGVKYEIFEDSNPSDLEDDGIDLENKKKSGKGNNH